MTVPRKVPASRAPRRSANARSARSAPAKGNVSHDVETYSRLLESASRLFAERGFGGVTVRDICNAADANVAAVSYHFGDKQALYMVVVERALEVVKKISDTTMDTSPNTSAEDKLRHYVHTFLLRIVRPDGRVERIQKLLNHEMAEPTPAVRTIVQHLIVPRLQFLGALVTEIIGCAPDDPRVSQCVMSIQAQCLFHAPDKFKSAAFPGWPATDDASIAAAADHITDFSLAGIRSLAAARPPRRPGRHSR